MLKKMLKIIQIKTKLFFFISVVSVSFYTLINLYPIHIFCESLGYNCSTSNKEGSINPLIRKTTKIQKRVGRDMIIYEEDSNYTTTPLTGSTEIMSPLNRQEIFYKLDELIKAKTSSIGSRGISAIDANKLNLEFKKSLKGGFTMYSDFLKDMIQDDIISILIQHNTFGDITFIKEILMDEEVNTYISANKIQTLTTKNVKWYVYTATIKTSIIIQLNPKGLLDRYNKSEDMIESFTESVLTQKVSFRTPVRRSM